MDEHKANITDFKREVCNYLDDVGNMWTVGIVIVASYIIYRLTRTIFALFCALSLYAIMPLFYRPNLKKYRHRWTVVTGATDGIGRAYTMELARRGLRKFVLIGRNSQKLADVRAQLASICASMTEQLSPLDVRTLQFDFFDGDFATLRAVLARLDVGLAVNSVGVGRELLERFGDNPTADSQLLRVNALGAAEFLSCVIPPMERNGGGQLVVLSSSQGVRPIPMLATYSASKSLLAFLCEAIDREYSTISCQCLIPALVATKMTYYKMLLNHLFPWTLLKYLILPIYWRQQKRVLRLHEERVSQSATVLTEQPGSETKTSTESSEFIVENGCAEKEPFKKTTAESLSFTNCLKNKSKIPKTSLPALSLRQRG